ncbi:monothiol glutaredoxin-5 protein [Rhizoctonia solani 123E]|uniref:Monothiol glutaredoxin-5, mitochondrial n=1 Tax=Rhizoctonia solani 123E TaxID=1423351 RepID=A0A074SB33_9AGAM|nr:monothiol glutaredoxin-5 protein [Rhizoctonia solani 123E]
MFRAGLRSISRTQFRQAVPPSRISVRLLSDEVRKTIDNAVKSKPLVLFMKGTPEIPQCGFSRAVVQILDLYEVPKAKMQTYNVLEDAELRNSIKEYSEWPTIPQLYVNGQFVGGCDIVMNMHQAGELEELLEKNEIIPPTPPAAKTE